MVFLFFRRLYILILTDLGLIASLLLEFWLFVVNAPLDISFAFRRQNLFADFYR
jgi:hypothetical protein